MNSLTTEAMAMVPLPLVTSWPVLRSRIATVMSAPALDASVVACRSRAASPVKATAGSSGGASGSGAMLPSGATTVSCGARGRRRRAVHLGLAACDDRHDRDRRGADHQQL